MSSDVTSHMLRVWNNRECQELWPFLLIFWNMRPDSRYFEAIGKLAFDKERFLDQPASHRAMQRTFYSPACCGYCSALGTNFSSLFIFWISDKLTAGPGSFLAPGRCFLSFSSSVEAGTLCMKGYQRPYCYNSNFLSMSIGQLFEKQEISFLY